MGVQHARLIGRLCSSAVYLVSWLVGWSECEEDCLSDSQAVGQSIGESFGFGQLVIRAATLLVDRSVGWSVGQ